MLYPVPQSRRIESPEPSLFDAMKQLFSTLSEDELDAVEDDLNFCRFTGLPSKRVEALLAILAKASPEAGAGLNAVDHAA